MEWTNWHEKHAEKIELIPGIDCWIWVGASGGHGYGRVSYNGVSEFAHRASYIEAGGNFDAGNIVRHMCGVPYCIRPGHLVAGTSKENAEDTSRMFQCGRSTSFETVTGIRHDYKMGMSLADLSQKYGMSQGSIIQVSSGRVYAKIAPETAIKPNRFPRKLDAEKAAQIHALIAQGIPQSRIAKQFDIAQSVVSRINTGARWAGTQDKLARLL